MQHINNIMLPILATFTIAGCQNNTDYHGSIDPENPPAGVVVEWVGVTEQPIGADLYADGAYPFTTNGWLSFKEDGSIYFYPDLNLFEDKQGYRLTLPDGSIAPRSEYEAVLKADGDVWVVVDCRSD